VPFTVTGSAPTNSIFVDSTGRVGLRTSTPVLDLHTATSNTPAHRFEQNNSGGFTAQTWDVAGNEANFFVRDVTGGSRLPFRIRPGAPTSSIDISASGNVGIGTASPSRLLSVSGSNAQILVDRPSNAASNYSLLNYSTGGAQKFLIGMNADAGAGVDKLQIFDAAISSTTPTMTFTGGSVGIGTAGPTTQLHTTGSVRFAGIACSGVGLASDGAGVVSCISSSRDVKNIVGALSPEVALANVMALRPQVGSYKTTPDVPEHWLIAEETAAVDPALVGLVSGKPIGIKTQNVVADLIAVVQQQQRRIEDQQRFIEEQQRRLQALEQAASRQK
jgi:hypothetical protein